MFALACEADDDPDLIELLGRLISGALSAHRPDEVWIHKIDTWFSFKWLGFSGKALGALGVWASPLTVPPFVSNRIAGKWYYRRDSVRERYDPSDPGIDIHHRGRSEENLRRRVGDIFPKAVLFWYCGQTQTTGRGSLMAHVPVEGKHWPWYVGFVREVGWRVERKMNIYDYEVRSFERSHV